MESGAFPSGLITTTHDPGQLQALSAKYLQSLSHPQKLPSSHSHPHPGEGGSEGGAGSPTTANGQTEAQGHLTARRCWWLKLSPLTQLLKVRFLLPALPMSLAERQEGRRLNINFPKANVFPGPHLPL